MVFVQKKTTIAIASQFTLVIHFNKGSCTIQVKLIEDGVTHFRIYMKLTLSEGEFGKRTSPSVVYPRFMLP